MKKSLVTVVALAMVAPAMAGISIQWTKTENAAQASDGTLLDKWLLTASASSGVIDAVEAGNKGTYGTTVIGTAGFTGDFYQVWTKSGFSYPPSPTEGSAQEVDTHWLFTPSSEVYGAEEDNSGKKWIYGPNAKTKIISGDLLITRGPEDGYERLKKIAHANPKFNGPTI